MKLRILLAGAVLGLGIPASALIAQKPAAAPRDWSRTVVQTPEGGFQMGNPKARVKLVEYGSLTCGHCAAFSREATAPLVGKYVKSGRVSYEFRNYVLNGLDVTASLIARCAGPSGFFRLADKIYATQDQWMTRIQSVSKDEKQRLTTLAHGERFGRLADLGGLTQLGTGNGLPAARSKKCLADPAALERLGQMAEAAEAMGVAGTPTFFINGQKTPVGDWAGLEPLIRRAGG